MTDAQLIDEVLAGNQQQFTILVNRYIPLVRSVCMSQVYSPSIQDDLAQDAFFESYRKLRLLRDRSRFGPWLATITRNKCRSWLRGQKRYAQTLDELQVEAPAQQSDSFSEITRRELCEWVRDTIAHLPGKTREAMLLCYVEGLSIREAAFFLGESENAVKQRLHYGRKSVSDKLWNDLNVGESLRKDEQNICGLIVAILPLDFPPPPATSSP